METLKGLVQSMTGSNLASKNEYGITETTNSNNKIKNDYNLSTCTIFCLISQNYFSLPKVALNALQMKITKCTLSFFSNSDMVQMLFSTSTFRCTSV